MSIHSIKQNSRFSHDITKIMQTKQLLILLSFYFHDEVLQHLKTFIYMNSWFRKVLCFAIEDV